MSNISEIGFDWHLRLSVRAKRPRLTISHAGRVELVWPRLMPKKHIPLMLNEHREWVNGHLKRIEKIYAPVSLPDEICFKSVNKSWGVEYVSEPGVRTRIRQCENHLHVQGAVHDVEFVRKELCRWLKDQGKKYLPTMLETQAQRMSLSYQSVLIRLQKHRWGSCSQKKRINLNAALLFLPEELVRHVLIHELVHLKHLNHSRDFWQDVAKFDPDYLKHRKQLKVLGREVPLWLSHPIDAI